MDSVRACVSLCELLGGVGRQKHSEEDILQKDLSDDELLAMMNSRSACGSFCGSSVSSATGSHFHCLCHVFVSSEVGALHGFGVRRDEPSVATHQARDAASRADDYDRCSGASSHTHVLAHAHTHTHTHTHKCSHTHTHTHTCSHCGSCYIHCAYVQISSFTGVHCIAHAHTTHTLTCSTHTHAHAHARTRPSPQCAVPA